MTRRVLCRFSCGAASAVATRLAILKYGEVHVFYNDTGSEHSDNARFIADCEKWFGVQVNVLRSEKFSNIWEVFEARRFLSSQAGAPCTSELKRIPGEKVWNPGDVEIFGYTHEESRRLDRFRSDNPERIIECPLIEKCLTKQDCLGILRRAGIALPTMYVLGFKNNNCIGCVKARDNINYWKRVRKYFPEIFVRMAKLERKFGVSINRAVQNGVRAPVYLDEIAAGDPLGVDTTEIQCGLFCMTESMEMEKNDGKK
jgi:3'-phosphoadenosine 5'-phosphosulfate sulfotransferase (PAPS reductase)/FAD synthetase